MLQGFEIAGADEDFEWADATIDGDTVVLRSPAVAKPLYIRYGGDDRPTWANLFSQDGLPAMPFPAGPAEAGRAN